MAPIYHRWIITWLVLLSIAMLPLAFRSVRPLRITCAMILCFWALADCLLDAHAAYREAFDERVRHHQQMTQDFMDGARQTEIFVDRLNMAFTTPIIIGLALLAIIPCKAKHPACTAPQAATPATDASI